MDTIDSSSFPHSPEEISVEWIRATLIDAEIEDGARVESVSLEPLTKEFGMTSDCFRLRLEYAIPNANAPATLFVKCKENQGAAHRIKGSIPSS